MNERPQRPPHLRLVTDGPPPPKPPRLRRGHELTPEQGVRLVSAIRQLRARYGTLVRVAEAVDLGPKALHGALYGPGGSMRVVVRVARLAGVPVETILDGTLASTDRCKTCGQKLPEKTP